MPEYQDLNRCDIWPEKVRRLLKIKQRSEAESVALSAATATYAA